MSANGQTGRRWPQLGAEATRALGRFGQAFTERPMDAARLAAGALREGYDCIVAVGGDGTLNEVVNGFFDGGHLIRPSAALGLLPRGTGGDFRRSFGWDGSMGSAIERLRGERTVPLDVGRVDFVDHAGMKASRYFVNVCSFGLAGRVDEEVNRGSKALGGKLSFALASAKALLRYSDRTVRFSVDGGELEEAVITNVAVANGQYFGGGMKVAPSADTSDGLFDVTVWSGYGLSDFLLRSKALYDGGHTRLAGTRQLRCRSLEAHSSQSVLLDVDGEQPGRLPCTMAMLPRALQLKA